MRLDGKPEGLRQSMSWLHAWTGILLGWLLYAVFFTGTLSYFLDEINLWMKPELHASVASPDAEVTAATALAGMARLAPNASQWTLELPSERQTTVQASWREKGETRTGRAGLKRAELDAATGEPMVARETRGGNFLYRFHFELHAMPRPVGRWIVGIATMFMFVAIISGVITHKKIFTDFFTFRPGKGQRSWLDAHNASAVLALPFHVMITFSGLMLLVATLLPWGAQAVYGDDIRAYNMERRGMAPAAAGEHEGRRESRRGRSGDGAAPVDLAATITPMLATAREHWPQREIGRIAVTRPGQPGATVELRAHGSDSLATRGQSARLVFHADGRLKEAPALAQPSAASAVNNVLAATHMGRFAGTPLRWLLFLSGVVGTAMVGTGLVLWVVKRLPERRKLGHTPFGHRLVESTNIAAIAGIALATAAYFWINRLIPTELPGRAGWEINGFFVVWALSLAHALWRPARAAWREQCGAVAVLYLLLPVLNPLTGGHGLFTSLRLGQGAIAGFDLAMLAIGALFGWIVLHLRRREARAQTAARPVPAPELVAEVRS